MLDRLEQLVRQVAEAATTNGAKVVLAESCTAGLAAHLLSRVPGASNWLCGSAVVYRNETKTAWLGVAPELLGDPDRGPVSEAAAAAMCAGALAATPEATIAASVTGHLGPDAPAPLDGRIYIGIQSRGVTLPPSVASSILAAELPPGSPFATLRLHRQHEAAGQVLQRLFTSLNSRSAG